MSPRVLIVESDPWLGDHFQRSLEGQHMTVIRAANAYSAMDMVDDESPTVIIMSLSLSGASSIALLHELQTYTDTSRIPIIVCTNGAGLTVEQLQPYGVVRLIDSMTMQPNDLAAAVRGVTVS